MIIADIASGGLGISLFGQGVKQIVEGYNARSNVEHLKDEISHIVDVLNRVTKTIANSQFALADIDLESPTEDQLHVIRELGRDLIFDAASCKRLPRKVSGWDWLSGKTIKLSDIDRIC